MKSEKFHSWRAIALEMDNTEHLLYMDPYHENVKRNYEDSFYSILTHKEQAEICDIYLERWEGTEDSGFWLEQESLNIPTVINGKYSRIN